MRKLVFPSLTTDELNEIRRKVSQGLAEIERGEAIECENEEELRQVFDNIRAEAYRNLMNKKRKEGKRKHKR